MKARIFANNGFVSAKIDLVKAVIFARLLTDRGNYHVRVITVELNKELAG